MGRLDDKVAIITGTSSGMGRASAVRFAEEGAKVVAVARRKERLAQLIDEIAAKGGDAIAVAADVSDFNMWQTIVNETLDKYGKIDIVMNNAGTGGNPIQGGIGEQIEPAFWEQVLRTNLLSVVYGTHIAGQYMSEHGGAVVNTCSISALSGMAGASAYTASKGGILSFTRAAAEELAPKGIRVNAICPGIISTEMVSDVVDDGNDQTSMIRAYWKSKTKLPMRAMGAQGDFGEGIDIANAALYLVSDESRYVTGIYLTVDGGFILD